MKKRDLILSCLLMTSLIGEITMADDNIAKGTTIGHYQKPGAPIDLTYSSTKVALNEVSDINISLTTSLKSGDMEVMINVDENLKVESELYDKITFGLTPLQKEYDILLKVSSSKDGLYYIRLSTKVDTGSGARMRSFAVPVYIGDGKLKTKSKQTIRKVLGGENISISNAEESVETIK